MEFSDDLDLDDRKGSQKDAVELEKVLKGFDVDNCPDYTSKLIEQKLKNVAKDKKGMNADSDCVLVVVLSHGDGEDNIVAQDEWYENRWKPFLAEDCPSLAGKPKLFFLNVCRGNKTRVRRLTTSQRRKWSRGANCRTILTS